MYVGGGSVLEVELLDVDEELEEEEDEDELGAVVVVVVVGAGAQGGAVPKSMVARTSRASRGSPIAEPVFTKNSSDSVLRESITTKLVAVKVDSTMA